MIFKEKFLCGHDERSWFVAAIPERAPVSSVRTAFEALRPRAVQEAIEQAGVPTRKRDRRRNAACIRQGEWFFVPCPGLKVDPQRVLRKEPLRRGAGKPHLCELLYRTGGTSVWVCNRHPNGLTDAQYETVVKADPEARKWGWRRMVRDPEVYVKGRVVHPDHKTVVLDPWHRVFPNTETQARSMRNVAFLD